MHVGLEGAPIRVHDYKTLDASEAASQGQIHITAPDMNPEDYDFHELSPSVPEDVIISR